MNQKIDLKIIAIIPALNEERTIEDVVRGTLRYVDLVVVVDDASTDETAELARRAGAVVITLKRRRRLGGVVKVGIEYVKRLNPEIVVMLDSDGQHDPVDIPRFLSPILEGVGDWVLGSRFLKNPFIKSSRSKNIGRRLFSHIVSLLAGKRITDAMSGFRAICRDAYLNLHLKFDYGYAPEMDMILCLEGYRMVEIPIKDRPRIYGKTKVVTNKLIYVLKQVGIVLFTFVRLKSVLT